MPISVTFVLGKKESYFFNTPKHWAWHNLPSDIEALFTQTPAIQDVIELALGNNGTYFVSYRDHGGKILCKHYNLPNALTSWLYCSNAGIIRDLSSLSITLGPYDSYYAWDSSSASWSNLPPKLEKSILNRLETQDVLQTTWKANGAEAPSFCLHLFPSHPNAYILITTGGKAFSNLPEFTWPDYNKIAPAFPSFTQTRSPIPPIPQPPPMRPQLQYTQQSSQQTIPQQRPNCCPNNTHMGQYNCCPQQTTHSAPYRISPAFVNALGAPLAQTGPFNTPTSTQYNVSGSNANMGGPVYR
ncbi:hypothetical protein SNOG_05781 [Parastagonospora nodorum SN15]|uniref:Uncharacterized protein n=1 Tax=Phaeosphaeria nodorum (strain SN15 / ATCC MYA-4574 / FGSC 10173) TaxID=321614 RepID=Q0UR33_PHANO|nr:hypothetical protein SNOG_05781 [Parastagonospora nodorum SN15]EAT86845.1 hypothetical protein SNOG_05781 [Parastagonospora nodorum SN15]